MDTTILVNSARERRLGTWVAIIAGYGHIQLSKAVALAELKNLVLFHGKIFTDLTVR